MLNVGVMAKVVLVSGATSTIGSAIVKRLAFAGYSVAAADECANSVGKIAEENSKVGGKVTAFAVDIKQAAHRKELIEKVASHFGRLDALVAAPYDNRASGSVVDASAMQLQQIFDGVVTTPFRLIQSAMPELERYNGSVVLLSSSLGLSPTVDVGTYAVANTSLLAMTKSLALSAARKGVRVNGVCNAMIAGGGTNAVWDRKMEREVENGLQSMIPLGRFGRPAEAASLVQFLISERARYITGENVVLSGGISFRL